MSKTTVKALYFVAGALFTLAVVASGWYGIKPVDLADPVDVIAFPDPPSAPSPPPVEVEAGPYEPVVHLGLLRQARQAYSDPPHQVIALQEELAKTRKHLGTHHADVDSLKLWLAARDREVEQLHREIGAVCYGIESR